MFSRTCDVGKHHIVVPPNPDTVVQVQCIVAFYDSHNTVITVTPTEHPSLLSESVPGKLLIKHTSACTILISGHGG